MVGIINRPLYFQYVPPVDFLKTPLYCISDRMGCMKIKKSFLERYCPQQTLLFIEIGNPKIKVGWFLASKILPEYCPGHFNFVK